MLTSVVDGIGPSCNFAVTSDLKSVFIKVDFPKPLRPAISNEINSRLLIIIGPVETV